MMMTLAQCLFTLFLYGLGALLIGAALLPSTRLLVGVWEFVQPATAWAQAGVLAFAIGQGFFLFGICVACETVLLRALLNLRLREGQFPYFSFQAATWAFVNSLILLVNLTFMDFMKLTPLLPLYYRLMGARVGHRVQINTKSVIDVSLLEIGDDTVIGGDAVLICHIAERGLLKLKRTRIGRGVTVGLGSVIMPGCQIGDGAMIAARSVLAKETVVPPNTLFAGTPARLVRTLEARRGDGDVA